MVNDEPHVQETKSHSRDHEEAHRCDAALAVPPEPGTMPPSEAWLSYRLVSAVRKTQLETAIRGVKSFYVPRSHPDGVSVNVRCLDSEDVGEVVVKPFDGQNWEANVDELGSLDD
jgi:hypothetical protein